MAPARPQGESPQRFGKYEIYELLGRGGMAEVYRARPLEGPMAGHTVALKRMLPQLTHDLEAVDLFTGEADVSRLLKHPHIVEVFEVGAVGEIYYIAMEFVDGRDLAQVCARCKGSRILLPVPFVLYIGRALLSALAYAHRATGPTGIPLNVIHCDVSPSNLFVSRLGAVKLGDFGIAKAHAFGEGDGRVWGKLAYVAPELLTGRPPSPASDLWAAAVTLYELLANQRPFAGNSVEQVQEAILEADPRPLWELRDDLNGPLAQAVMRGLSARPERRYPSAEEFLAALPPEDGDHDPLGIASVVRLMFPGDDT